MERFFVSKIFRVITVIVDAHFSACFLVLSVACLACFLATYFGVVPCVHFPTYLSHATQPTQVSAKSKRLDSSNVEPPTPGVMVCQSTSRKYFTESSNSTNCTISNLHVYCMAFMYWCPEYCTFIELFHN